MTSSPRRPLGAPGWGCLLALVLAGCGTFQEEPAKNFQATFLSPVAGEFCLEECYSNASSTAQCSVFDPVLAASVQVKGCERWSLALVTAPAAGSAQGEQDTWGVRVNKDRSVASLPMDQAIAGSTRATAMVACFSESSTRTDYSLEVSFSDLAVQPHRAQGAALSAVLESGDLVVADDAGTDTLKGDGTTVHNTWPGAAKKVFALGDGFLVVKEGLSFGSCPHPAGEVVQAFSKGGSARTWCGTERGLSVDAAGLLGSGRVALVGHESSAGPLTKEVLDRLVVVTADADLGHVSVQQLPEGTDATIESMGRLGDGSLVFAGFSRDGRLRPVRIDAKTEKISLADLGTEAVATPQTPTAMTSDGSLIVIGTNPVVVRDPARPERRWTMPGAAVRALVSDRLVLLRWGALELWDPADGALVWSHTVTLEEWQTEWAVVSPVRGGVMFQAQGSGAYNADTRRAFELRVFGLDGTPRATLLGAPGGHAGVTVPFIADGRGHLAGFTADSRLTITAADSDLNAGRALCSRADCGAGVVDLGSDTANCGACGTRCSSGSCVGGRCEQSPEPADAGLVSPADAGAPAGPADGGVVASPVTVLAEAEEPMGLAVDSQYLYWADYWDGAIRRMDRAGGPTTTLVDGQDGPVDLVSDGQSLYWLNYGDGYVNRMPSAGGAVTRLAKSEPGLSMGLAADSDNVYWIVDGLGLLKVAQSGGDPQVLAWGDSLGDLLWVQGETVYFYSDIVRTVPRTGGQSVPLRLEPSCPTEWGEYVCSYLELYRRASAVGVPVRLSPSTTVDSESVYSTMGGNIERLHSNGVYWQTLAIDKAEIRSMVVADDYIYWASSDGRIKRILKNP